MSGVLARIDPAEAHDFAGSADGAFEAVGALHAEEPTLVNAAWDRGAGDRETGLGASARMGRREAAR